MSDEKYEIKSTDTLIDLKGRDGQYFATEKYNDAVTLFCGQIRSIIDLYNRLVGPGRDGELIVLLNRTYKYRGYGEIPYSKIDEIKTWIHNNWFRYCQILMPEYHNQLIQTDNEYSRWFVQEEKKHQTQPHYSDSK